MISTLPVVTLNSCLFDNYYNCASSRKQICEELRLNVMFVIMESRNGKRPKLKYKGRLGKMQLEDEL